MRTRGRDISIDTLRGIAIILMVAGHVVGVNASVGMRVEDDSAWRIVYALLADMRMPLFTALSGFVYALRPLPSPSRYGKFAFGKARRLIIPLLTVGTLFALTQALTPGTNSETALTDVWRVWLFELGHFWFLQALFLIFLVVGIADALGALRTPSRVTLAIAITSVPAALISIPKDWAIYSVDHAIELLPFFLLGYGLSRYWGSLDAARWTFLLCTSLLFALRSLEVFGVFELPRTGDTVLGVALGITAITTLVAFRRELSLAWLARLGYFSFAIYLLHVFGTAPTRMLLGRVGVDSEVVVFTTCLAVGLALPVLFEITLGRVRWISWTFLGQKPYRSPWKSGPASSAPGTKQRPREVPSEHRGY